VRDEHEVPDGYQVNYVWRGEAGTVRMDHDPGRRIPVKDGELVTSRGGTDSGSG
jgi:uncharacterized protein YcfJ